MKLIESSDEKISFNSGCTCREAIPIKDYFDGMNPCGFKDQMDWWIESMK